jgi:enoyl-CoA hydratase/carnithine racemase
MEMRQTSHYQRRQANHNEVRVQYQEDTSRVAGSVATPGLKATCSSSPPARPERMSADDGSALAAGFSLRAIWESLEMGLTDAYHNGYAPLTAHWDHPDAAEDPKAFLEKREPAGWTGA